MEVFASILAGGKRPIPVMNSDHAVLTVIRRSLLLAGLHFLRLTLSSRWSSKGDPSRLGPQKKGADPAYWVVPLAFDL